MTDSIRSMKKKLGRGEIIFGTFNSIPSASLLNAIGFLCLVYAFRYGKAIIVSPMVNAVAPVITVVLSLIIYSVIPHPVVIAGMVFAITAAFLMAIEPEDKSGNVS